MRRALVIVLVGTALSRADASPWSITGEAGGELDSNVQRVETGPGLMTEPIQSGVMRFGARAERKGKIAGGSTTFNLSNLTRIVTNADASVENVSVFATNLRWLHRLGERPALAGFALSAIDALP